MPNRLERQRNNVKAGIFVSLALLLGLGVVVVLTDAMERFRRQTRSYVVVFDVGSGVPNIKRGSEVRVGGVRMGQVTAVEPRVSGSDAALSAIDVRFNLDKRVPLFNDAQIFVSAPLIGSEGWLDIPHVGSPTQGTASEQSPIAGASSTGFLTTLLGGENKDKAQQIVDNAVDFSDFLARLPIEYNQQVAPIFQDVKSTTGDLRSVFNEFRNDRWPAWSARVDDLMTWAGAVPEKIDQAIAEGTGLMTDAREIVAENRPSIRTSIENVQEVTSRFRTETVDKVHALLATGQEGLDSATATLKNVELDYAAWATDVGEALGAATIASQQLKLATIEVRRSPWKLLYRPTADELEHELLYEATRSFAVAAADLKAAAASMQRVMAANDPQALENAEAFQRIQQSLLDSLDRYERAQQRMLDVIIADRPE